MTTFHYMIMAILQLVKLINRTVFSRKTNCILRVNVRLKNKESFIRRSSGDTLALHP